MPNQIKSCLLFSREKRKTLTIIHSIILPIHHLPFAPLTTPHRHLFPARGPPPPLRDIHPVHPSQMIHIMVFSCEATFARVRLLTRAPAGTTSSIRAIKSPGREVYLHVTLEVVIACERAVATCVYANVRFGCGGGSFGGGRGGSVDRGLC